LVTVAPLDEFSLEDFDRLVAVNGDPASSFARLTQAQFNAGTQAPEASLAFTMTQVATFNLPWRIAFLPDGRMLITEKVGPLWLVTQQGAKTPAMN